MKILVADKFEKQGIEGLKSLGAAVDLNPDLADATLAQALKTTDYDVLVVRSTKVSADILGTAMALKVVIRAGAGVDTIDTGAAKQRGIKVANCPGTNSVAVAELTLGLMLSLDRRIPDNVMDLRKGVWAKKEYSTKAQGLKGRTLGIVGLGRIGYEVAKRAKAFDMHLLYHDVVEHTQHERDLGVRKVSFEEILKQSDFVCLHVPGGSETKHLIGERELAMMKPTAFLINCSRGGVIDESALAKAIESGKFGGAGLDVYENEPGANDTSFAAPIAKVDRVYGTHHIGASTEQAQLAVAEEVVRIVAEYNNTGNVLHCVNP